MPYPVDLAPGDRLVLESKGSVDGFAADSSGAIPGGALVARFEDGPPFLVGTGRLLWTAPRAGRLAFSVEQRGAGDVSGGYDVRVTPLGPPGDRRQRGFPPPTLRFLPASKAAVLALAYEDRAGFGLDLRSLKVFLDTRDRRRVVLSPYFTVGSDRAVLRALPSDVDVPAGLHSVTATIADALGNVSAPAVVFLDRP